MNSTFSVSAAKSRDGLIYETTASHRRFCELFSECTSARAAGIRGPSPSLLHLMFDRLLQQVDRLSAEMAFATAETRPEIFFAFTRGVKAESTPDSFAALFERQTLLIDRLRDDARAAAEQLAWGDADDLAELAHRVEESLWGMVVELQEEIIARPCGSTN